jgi:hypothetical protein
VVGHRAAASFYPPPGRSGSGQSSGMACRAPSPTRRAVPPWVLW